MKDRFFEYYPLSKKTIDKIWKDGLFVFDANILLDLYKYPSKHREDFFNFIYEHSDRVWMPHQFAMEYHKNRLGCIIRQVNIYSGNIRTLQSLSDTLDNHPFLKIKRKTIEIIKKEINDIDKKLKKLTKKYADLYKKDLVRDKLTKLLKGKIGNPYNDKDKRWEKIQTEGQARYLKEIPPGYDDVDKKNRNELGDLIGWFQVIDKAKQDKKHVIFITNEKGSSWWQIQGDGKLVSPRCELTKEFFTETEGMAFCMYSMNDFLKKALPEAEITKETKEISKEEERENVGLNSMLYPSGFLVSSSDNDVVSSHIMIDGSELFKTAIHPSLFGNKDKKSLPQHTKRKKKAIETKPKKINKKQ